MNYQYQWFSILVSFFLVSSSVYSAVTITPPLFMLSPKSNIGYYTIKNDGEYKAYVEMVVVEQICVDSKEKYFCSKRKDAPTKISDDIKFSSKRFILNPTRTKKIYVQYKGEWPEKGVMLRIFPDDKNPKAMKKITSQDNRAQNIELILKVRHQSRLFLMNENVEAFTPLVINRKNNNLSITNNNKHMTLVRVHGFCSQEGKCEQFKKTNEKLIQEFIPAKNRKEFILPSQNKIKVRVYNYITNEWDKGTIY